MNKFFFIQLCLSAACAWLAPASATAQVTCDIQGHMAKDTLRFSAKKIQKVYLSKFDDNEQFVKVDSCDVKNGNFSFSHKISNGEPVMMFFITGFDNGDIPVWVEPGTVKVEIGNAAFASSATVEGTATNNLYNEYKAIAQRCLAAQKDSLNSLFNAHGEEYMNSDEGRNRMLRLGAAELVECDAERLQFLLDHNDSPLAPIMMERELVYSFNAEYAANLVKCISPDLHKHPYYRMLANYVKAQNIKVGAELPDIKLQQTDGQTKYLSDYAGKYVVLDFWASWCAPCIKELPYVKQVYEEAQKHSDKLIVISVSLDSKKENWLSAIEKHDIKRNGWIHASDLLGWNTPAAKILGVESIPRIMLVDPEGRAVALDLRGEQLINKIKEIMR